ncbi:MAG: FGGY-family carbohydrate kinase [Phycisphaerae bacterium]
MTVPNGRFYLGIDVGTGSARAAIFDYNGRMLAAASRPINTWRPQPDFVEQSSGDIWRGCCDAVRRALADAAVTADRIGGIGFDATCSLVALNANDRPVSVSPTENDDQNVIVWMDHRALDQTRRINTTQHEVLRYVGGTMSVEMQSPKLLWIKENLPESWKRTARFLDLPDFLTYKATGVDTRSLCSTVCKWTYLGHEQPQIPGSVGRWDESFFRQIGLGDLVDDEYRRIGQRVRPMGEPIGEGLCSTAARELGLNRGTPVGVAIIDAHAGGLGVLGAIVADEKLTPDALESRVALIGGTSSCHMAVSREARSVPGVWGPYYSAMIPDMWLTEGGQSATGALVDHVIFSHPRAAEVRKKARRSGQTVYEALNDRLDELARKSNSPAQLTHDLHILPYFHGNRSPRADATLRGVVAGLSLSDTIDDLALLYLATIQAIAHGTRHIIDTMNSKGYQINTVFACGGGTKNPVFLREHADITGCQIILPYEPEAVLLGAAVLGAVAAGDSKSVLGAMAAMTSAGDTIEPAVGEVKRYHDAKHKIFHRMYDDFTAYREIMQT